MSENFFIDIEPKNKTQLRLNVRANSPAFPAAGIQLNRKFPVPNLQADQIRALQSGEAQKTVVDAVTDAVSNWLQKPQLELGTALGLFGPDQQNQWRIVLHIAGNGDVTVQRILQDFIDVPVELVRILNSPGPVILNNKVAGIVHMLDKVVQPSGTPGEWPLRILLVRSSPKDMVGEVSKAAPLRQSILDMRPDLGPNLLRVEILTREAPVGHDGIVGLPTRQDFARRVESGWDIVVYLGHGDKDGDEGMLLLESADGTRADPYRASQLSQLLSANSVPVVLLVGCLTAANPGDISDDVKNDLVKSSQGSLGVAQALINGASSVKFAVGMRCKIENSDADLFLSSFFKSLLTKKENVGNVELAVRYARSVLRVESNSLYGWAAPVVFSILPDEPMFPMLASAPSCPEAVVAALNDNNWLGILDLLGTVKMSDHGTPANPRTYERILELVSTREDELAQNVKDAGSVLFMPVYTEVPPAEQGTQVVQIDGANQDRIKKVVQVALRGTLDVQSLEGNVRVSLGIGQADPAILSLSGTDGLTAAGYDLLPAPRSSKQMFFRIQPRAGVAAVALPEGPLINVTLALPPASPIASSYFRLSLDGFESDPNKSVCGGVNIVVVPAP